MKDLRLEGLVVLHPGTASYPLGERVGVMPLATLAGGTADTLFPPKRSEGRRKGSPRSPREEARSKRLAEVSGRVRKESPRVNAEFAAIEKDPDA